MKKEEKENKEETDAEILQNRLNTLKIRFALLTKNGNTEFSKLNEVKPEPAEYLNKPKQQGTLKNF